MARQITQLSVFVASPSDVEEERRCLEDVIRELNLVWAGSLGIRLELVKWETHAYPDFGDDAQSVINKQISQDYDIFLGIMWCTAGTPTGRAESGTIEEFQLAKKRHDADPNSVRLMFYFKDEQISPSLLDLKQVQRVADFRSSLGEDGALYWMFKTTDEFERVVRLHLTQHVQSWSSSHGKTAEMTAEVNKHPATESTKEEEARNQSEDADVEVGLLDLEDTIGIEMGALEEVIDRIVEATTDLGHLLEARTSEIKSINSAGPKSAARNAFRRVIARTAADMDKYVSRMDAEVPLFSGHLERGISAFTSAVPILMEFPQKDGDGDGDDRTQIWETVRSARESMSESLDTMEQFRSEVSSLPSLTTAMNRSRRATAKMLQRLVDNIGSALLELAEVEKLIEAESPG